MRELSPQQQEQLQEVFGPRVAFDKLERMFCGGLVVDFAVMKPIMPFLFPRLLPGMMPKVMPDMLAAVGERIPMPEPMQEQMPDLI